MGNMLFLLCVYVLGGLTFIPCLVALVLAHAYFTFPTVPQASSGLEDDLDTLSYGKGDGRNLKSAAALLPLGEKFQRGHEPDVAAGYFAVCREYVPGGVNGKPPERTTPAGAVVETESPSVYQSMYRSIFDRRQGPTLDAGKGNVKPTRRARNIFFVVLRHGHLMLYDDVEQVEVRHVISLEHHKVSIYGGEDHIPEGELWIKRNAIRLAREDCAGDATSTPKPFYFFTENCSEKEDFYFALLHNQEVKPGDVDGPPRPQLFKNRDIVTLVQQLHSSEEQLQTRWINAIVGRLFLASYKTPEMEEFIRQKITKKIARVKKPAFLSGIILRKIDMGESAPSITNPRLRDLTIDGDCCAEADINYRGNFRLEIATTARIDLGARFKVREVNIVLAAVVKRIEGHILIKFKPPPSNRVWISFETMPDIGLSLEPIVSSRQITYSVILRAIESRIREVVAETIVLPHWDDSPFLDTSHQRYRGGIWRQDVNVTDPTSQHTEIPDEAAADEAEAGLNRASLPPASPQSKDDRSMSSPTLAESAPSATAPRKVGTFMSDILDDSSVDPVGSGISSNVQPPKVIRSHSFASAADPLISMDQANITSPNLESRTTQNPDATSSMKAISHKSRPTSPVDMPAASLSADAPALLDVGTKIQRERDAQRRATDGPAPSSSPSTSSVKSIGRGFTGEPMPDQNGTRAAIAHEKKQSLGTIGAATAAAAKSWGWNVLSRTKEYRQQHHPDGAGTPESPIGRGRPLPPPGQPLPLPQKPSTRVVQNGQPQRKPLPASPISSSRRQSEATLLSEKAPPLPSRRKQAPTSDELDEGEGLLVVAMPSESQAATPQREDQTPQVLSATENDSVGQNEHDASGNDASPSLRGSGTVSEGNGALEPSDGSSAANDTSQGPIAMQQKSVN